MQKPNLVACLVILLTFSAPALAGGAPGSSGAPGSTGYPGGTAPGATVSPSTGSNDGGSGVATGPKGGREGGGSLTPEKLASIKTDILKHMDERIAEIQQRKQCVQAAMTGEALHSCMPGRPGRGGPEGGEHQGKQ